MRAPQMSDALQGLDDTKRLKDGLETDRFPFPVPIVTGRVSIDTIAD